MTENQADLIEDLESRLAGQIAAGDRDYGYYDARARFTAQNPYTPPELRRVIEASVGVCRLYIDAVEERLDVEGFRLAEDKQDDDGMKRLWDWWQVNGLDEESPLAHIDAMIYRTSYVTVTEPGEDDVPDVPVIRVESPRDMVAYTDPRTRKVTRAWRLYRPEPMVNQDGAVSAEDQVQHGVLYLPEGIYYKRRDKPDRPWYPDPERADVPNKTGEVPVVPMPNKPRASQLGGSSEITPELQRITNVASLVLACMSDAAVIMAGPQRVAIGTDLKELGETPTEIHRAAMGRILGFADPDVKVQQFAAAELRNYVEALGELWKQAAAYTGLPPQYLSYQSDNPASAEAIKASESRLIRKVERKQRTFGGAWERVMRLAIKVMDGEIPDEYYRLETQWRDASTPTDAAIADAVYKLYDKGEGVIPLEFARRKLGYTDEERREMAELDKQKPPTLASALVGAAGTTPADSSADSSPEAGYTSSSTISASGSPNAGKQPKDKDGIPDGKWPEP